ncbi:MAG: hypothetical protein V1656_00560 [Candidatus Jorgensenbacteria bacterium]
MKQHSKVGNRPGRPTYRTPATFRYRHYKNVKTWKAKEVKQK